MALAGNMIASSDNGDHSIVNYSMFCAVIAMVSLIYLILGTINESWAGIPWIMTIVDALNAIFFLCGGIAMAAHLGAHSCSNEVSATCHHASRTWCSHLVGLHKNQPRYQQRGRYGEALPRSSGCVRLPMVRLRRIRHIGNLIRFPKQRREFERTWHRPRSTSYVSGINRMSNILRGFTR